MTPKIFPVGATYAPLPKATEVDPSEWPRDIENFASLGFNTFRLFLCWDRIEQQPGKRDFSRVDLAFELAARHGLRVIANVGGTFTNLQAIYPPRHLVYEEHCTLLKPTPDADETLRFNRFKLCYDDPRYQELTREFLHCAVARYKDHPALLAWSGWNEPRLAECYCRHTVALYRKWLERRYGDLETLAKAWSGEFPVRFRSWEDVNPQPEASFEAGGYVPFLDWRRFLAENRTDKFHLVKSWIREVDPETPVISHLCGPRDADIFGPSVPKMFHVEDARPYAVEKDGRQLIEPIEKYGVKLLSIGFFVNPDTATLWRGGMASNALKQLIADADWGDLDYFILDTPPGTSDIHLTLLQTLAITGAIIVSTPQKVALADARKGIDMYRNDKVNVPILGLVENMAWFTPAELPGNKYYIFGREGCKELAKEMEVPLLAQIPLVQSICESGDAGEPAACSSETATGLAFINFAQAVVTVVNRRNREQAPTHRVEVKE